MTTAASTDVDPSAAHRLPYSVDPRRYDLRLRPDLEGATFTGTVTITADARESVDVFVLHAQDLDVAGAALAVGDAEGEAVPVRVTPDAHHDDRIVLTFDRPVGPGPITVSLTFAGVLNDMLHGFYRSTFTDDEGATHVIATTQFEATDARRAFPCLDEPDRKAAFAVTIDVPPGNDAFSNGPEIERVDLDDGWQRVRFGDTIPMSTYLVAFAVGPFRATDPVDVDGVPVRVVHVPGREPLTGFALDVAAHALRFFSDWFAIPYPAEKLDLLAVPDFAAGAMENLGCVTFRENALLVDHSGAARADLERVAHVVAHEIAHMWFGDLVTMKWWNGIWLNEAFATFMEVLCVDAYRPEWERWVSFGVDRQAAMETDALHSTRPVEYPVGPPEEARGMFDVLTYEKGGAVLRMLERHLGAERFRDGIRRYLDGHRLGNTVTADLWSALADASGEPVGPIMDTWILQGGFPVIHVKRIEEALELTQEPCTFGPPKGDSAVGERWRIPLGIRTLGDDSVPGESVQLVLDDQGATIPLRDSAPVVVNAHGDGFFRVAYDDDSARALLPLLDKLDTLERFGILTDTWTEIQAGRAPLDRLLQAAERLRRDDDPDVWSRLTGPVGTLDHVADEADRDAVAGYMRALAGPRFAELGWDPRAGEPERVSSLRAQLLRALGTVGADEEVRARCVELHRADSTGRTPMHAEMAPAVVAVVARAGDPDDYETFLRRYRHGATPQEQLRYLYGLAGFPDPVLGTRTYAIALDEARSQDAPFVVASLLASRAHGTATWDRVVAQWDDLLQRFPENLVTRMLESAKWLCRDPGLADSVARHLLDHPLPSGQRTIAQTVELLGVNVGLAARVAPVLGPVLGSASARLAPSR
ncbi:MAG: M1 family metallopeptidase [Acidimicrobiales bacterium]